MSCGGPNSWIRSMSCQSISCQSISCQVELSVDEFSSHLYQDQCQFIYSSFCLSLYMSVYTHVCLLVCLSVFLFDASFCSSIYMAIWQFDHHWIKLSDRTLSLIWSLLKIIFLSVYLLICLSVYQSSVHPSLRWFVCSSVHSPVCLSLNPYVRLIFSNIYQYITTLLHLCIWFV
jgi:hypothetical protein